MPHPNLYLRGYNLHTGLELAGWRLDHIEIHHKTIVEYHSYEYPTNLFWVPMKNGASSSALLSALKSKLTDRTINSEYKNPYHCRVGSLKVLKEDNEHVVIGFNGSCVKSAK